MPSEHMDACELKPEQLRWECNPASLEIKTITDVPPCNKIIGQDRAVRALELGLNIQSHGYNIYISGLTGTGKTTTVKKLLEQMNAKGDTPDDICYVNNFNNADSPGALFFPAGQGNQFAADMDETIQYLQNQIPRLWESDIYTNQQKTVMDRLKTKSQKILSAFEEKVKKEGLALVQIQAGLGNRPEVVPVIEKNAVPWQNLGELITQGKIKEEEAASLRKKHDQLMEELEEIGSTLHNLNKSAQNELKKLQQDVTRPTIQTHVKSLKKKYPGEKVNGYLDAVQNHILHHLKRFEKHQENTKSDVTAILQTAKPPKDPTLEYRVNVIVDNSQTKGTPIVTETAPTFSNLFGLIERAWHPPGIWQTDFTKIKAGSLLKANGGFLVFNLIEALAEPDVWKILKRSLKNQQVIIQEGPSSYPPVSSAIKPEPIEINLKVIVIGDDKTYRLIYDLDDEFKKIFKIRADFDTVMSNNTKAIKDYLSFMCKICKDENLLPLDASAAAEVIEYGVFLAGKKKKLSTRFSDIADIVREAHYWAVQEKKKIITGKHIEKAIQEKEFRLKLVEEKIQEMIEEGTLMIDIKGKRVGQVNGLSVYSLGDYMFGKPSKITAEAAMGKSGIINIERESGMGGRSYNKGVLIIAGYLRRMYAQDKPLTMSASLCFEQSYSGVDGDSASSTEIYGLLSSLSGVPLRQDIAVTGSVNQKGEIQPIGGVNEKIEGFFDVCKAKGLTGKQGVMIPKSNMDDLMLRYDLVDTVKKGRFHIWAVETVDQGIELLTGKPAGGKDRNRHFQEGTIHFLVNKRLKEFAEKMKTFEGKA